MSNSRITPVVTGFIAIIVVAVILYILNMKPKTPELETAPEPNAPIEVVAPVDNAVEAVVAPIDATKITQ